MVTALYHVFLVNHHVITQIIKAEFIVGSIGDIAVVGLSALVIVQVMHDNANCKPKELVHLSHPLGITPGQVVIHSDQVNAFAFQGV